MEYWRVWSPVDEEVIWGVEDAGTMTFRDRHGGHDAVWAPAALQVVGNVETTLRQYFGPDRQFGRSDLGPGECRPRIWRNYYSPRPSSMSQYARAWSQSVQAARNLFVDMHDVFRCVEPSAANHAAYGHRIRELLMLACTEVESACKHVLEANNYKRSGHWNTTDYVKLLAPMRLDEWELALAMHGDFGLIKPFAGWTAAQPTPSLTWYAAYNAVKHERESAFQRGTLEAMVQALGAVFVMVSAQFGPTSLVDLGLDGLRLSRDQYQWSQDFVVCADPVWAQSEFYVPHEAAGTQNPGSRLPWTLKPLW